MPFDHLYVVEPSYVLEKDFTFYGYQNSKIIQDVDGKRWKIEMLNDHNIHATTEGSDPPFGTRKYRVFQPKWQFPVHAYFCYTCTNPEILQCGKSHVLLIYRVVQKNSCMFEFSCPRSAH